MPIDEARRTSFGDDAAKYDAVRPPYPEELISKIIQFSGVSSESRILEIGAGTGKATRAFLERGFSVTAIEPDENLFRFLQTKVRKWPSVECRCEKFEDLQTSTRKYNLIYSAQAFHWIPKECRYSKSRALLSSGGTLALFWNMTDLDAWSSVVRQPLDRVYAQFFPQDTESKEPQRSHEAVIQSRREELSNSGYFQDIEVWRYPWTRTYTTVQFVDLFDTYSEVRVLAPEMRQKFLAEVRQVLETNGGELRKPYEAVLYLARRKESL